MAASSDVGKVTMHFGWIGPTTWRGGWKNGGLDVGCIDLLFQNAATQVSVILPDGLDSKKFNALPFTCRRKLPWKETHPTALSLKIEQIRHLQLNAIILEKSPVSTWTMMDQCGNITHDTRILRFDRKVDFHVPSDLETGKTYILEVTSDDLSLSARLVEAPSESVLSAEDEAFAHDQRELFELLGGVLLPLMGIKLSEFTIRMLQTSAASTFMANTNINPQTIGAEVIQKEIQKIEKPVLKQLAEDLRQAKAAHPSKSLEERAAIEKKIVKACFDAMGQNSLQTIMRSNIESVIQSKITPELQKLIESIAARFQEICMNQVS